MQIISLLALLPVALGQFVPSPGNFPATGDDTIAGGIFCISLSGLTSVISQFPPWLTGTESPKAAGGITSGSGPYPAQMTSDPGLPNHTIYAPKTPPPGNLSMPFLSFGEGSCATDGSQYRNFLTEIASYGYVIAADGPPTGGSQGTTVQSKVQDSRDSINWAIKGGAAKFGNIATTNITAMGHSCGGLEAMSVSYHDDRIKHTILLDIAIFTNDKRYLLQQLKYPVAWFVGGPLDMGYLNVSPHLLQDSH
jgi:hypothetical protein